MNLYLKEQNGKMLKLVNPLSGMPFFAEIIKDTNAYLIKNKGAYIKGENVNIKISDDGEALINITIAVASEADEPQKDVS